MRITTFTHPSRMLAALAALGLACACSAPTASARPHTVAIRLAASVAPAPAFSAAPGDLAITTVRMVVGRASLGSGDQYGCIDCQGDLQEQSPPPQMLELPPDGSSVVVATGQVQAGSYSSVELSLEQPTAAMLAASPSWTAGATIEVAGRYRGVAFTLPIAVSGSFREALSPPVNVATAAATGAVSVHVTLPVATWFSRNGAALDPQVPAQRAQIEANARSTFQVEGATSEPAER